MTDGLPWLVHCFGIADNRICWRDCNAAVCNLLGRRSGVPTMERLRRDRCIIPNSVEHRHKMGIILIWHDGAMIIALRTIVPDQDYPHLVPVLNTVWDDAPVTAETLHGWDARTPPEQITHRRVAVTPADTIVGYAEAMYQPWKPVGHFWLWVVVDPEWRHQGIGSTLYDTMLHLSQPDGATTLLSTAYEHHPEGLDFAQH